VNWDLDDWFVAALVTSAWLFSAVFLWRHPTDLNFATFATLSATMIGAYHWISFKDDTTPDSEGK
jgi:hypothetical protein